MKKILIIIFLCLAMSFCQPGVKEKSGNHCIVVPKVKLNIDKKIIFIHGYNGSSKSNWYPDLKNQLDKLGIQYSIPDLPGGKYPHSSEWLKIIDNELSKIDKPIVLVGHSLGTRAVLLYLDKYGRRIDAVILIAPLSNEVSNAENRGGNVYPDFFEYKINIGKIRNLVKKVIIVYSIDDDVLPYQRHAISLAKEWGINPIIVNNQGHFNRESNASCILEILTLILID